MLVTQSCPTLGTLWTVVLWTGSSVHRILQARILEWGALAFSRAYSQPRDWTPVSHVAGRFFTIWATRKAPCGPRDSQESSPTPQFESINFSPLSLLYGPNFTSLQDYWKNHSFDYMAFAGKVIALLFNTLSRFVIAFLPMSKCLLIRWLQSPSAVILEPKKIKSVTVSIVSPSICHEVLGLDAMIFIFWILSFKPAFHSSLSPSSRDSLVPLCFLPLQWCHLYFWGYWYFSQQSWFQLVLECVFCMLYPVYKLNKQGDSIQPWHTPFSIWNQSVVPCPVLTVASWPAYRFLKRQVRWSGTPISWRIFQFVVIHTVKGFSIVNEAEVNVFPQFP